MKVAYTTGIWLASGGREGTNGAHWNGKQINSEEQFFRAAASVFFPRGNRSTQFSFSVLRSFDGEGSAIAFASTHINDLPGKGDLYLIDEEGTVSLKLPGAVLDSISYGPLIGLAITVQYQFSGGLFEGSDTPPDIAEDDILKTGSVDLDVDDESKVVAFPVAFGSAPLIVECWVTPPSGGSQQFIQSVAPSDLITSSQFTAKIGFPIPETGYKLSWVAYNP